MRPTILTAVLLSLSVFVLSGATCQRVQISDHELCGDKGKLGAKCFHLISDESRALDFDAWAKERFGQICMQADGWANIKAALLKLCDQTKRCTWQEKEDIENLGEKISSFKLELE